MKNTLYRNPGKVLLGMFALALVGFTACQKDDKDNENPPGARFTLAGNASGDQEVPPVTTAATGSLTGSYDSSTNILIYSINWNGLSGDVSMAHFHGPAAAGNNADVLLSLNLVEMAATGAASDTIEVSSAFESALLSGNVYYNIHTLANPAGEIRGQVLVDQ